MRSHLSGRLALFESFRGYNRKDVWINKVSHIGEFYFMFYVKKKKNFIVLFLSSTKANLFAVGALAYVKYFFLNHSLVFYVVNVVFGVFKNIAFPFSNCITYNASFSFCILVQLTGAVEYSDCISGEG